MVSYADSFVNLFLLTIIKPIPHLGPDNLLRFRLATRLRELKADDVQIANEGINNLNVQELQVACRERGMRSIGISEEGLRQRLQQW